MPTGNATFYFSEDSGQEDLYVMPYNPGSISLANWNTLRRAATELASPNLGLYSVSLDQAQTVHRVFKGSTVPSSWDDHLHELELEFTSNDDLLEAIEGIDVGGGGSGGGVISVPSVLVNAGYDPSMIVVFRGATWSFIVERVTIPFPIDDMVFTLRKQNSDDENESIVQISMDDGLFISNGAPALDPTLGSIAIGGVVEDYDDENIRDITITVHSEETQNYPVTSALNYDLKTIRNGTPVRNAIVHSSQKFVIAKDITRRIT